MRSMRCGFTVLAFAIVTASPSSSAQTPSYEECNRARDAQARLSICAAFLETNPSDPHQIFIAHLRRGTAYLMLNDPTSAIAEYDLLISRQPDNQSGYANRGLAKFHLRDLDGAIADITRGIELGAEDASVFATRAAAYYHKGDVEPAFADASHALSVDANNIFALVTRGSILQTRGEWHAALADFTRASELNPRDPSLHVDRAGALVEMGEFREAGNAITAAIALAPNDAALFRDRAEIHARSGDFRVALADMDSAFRLAPDDPRTLLLRAFVYELQGEFDRAAPDITRALALAPDMPDALVSVGRMRFRNGDVAGALAAYDRAVALEPSYNLAFYLRAQVNGAIGNFSAASADLDAALASGVWGDAHNARGYLRLRLGDTNGARSDFLRAIELTPANLEPLHNLAWLALLNDQDAEALQLYSQLLAAGYGQAGAYVERALAYWSMGDMANANADIARALEIEPDHYYGGRARALFSAANAESDASALSAHGTLLLYLGSRLIRATRRGRRQDRPRRDSFARVCRIGWRCAGSP